MSADLVCGAVIHDGKPCEIFCFCEPTFGGRNRGLTAYPELLMLVVQVRLNWMGVIGGLSGLGRWVA